MQVRIINLAEVRVAALEHLGPPALLDDSVQKFVAWRQKSGQSPIASRRTFGIPGGNPNTTPAEHFRFVICAEIHESLTPNTVGVHERVISGGRYAVIRHIGSTDRIGESIEPLFRDWLPSSGEELAERPLFFEYLSVYPPVAQDQRHTDIYVPLK